MLLNQRSIRHLHGRPLDALNRLASRRRAGHWLFTRYLNVAHPAFALPAPPAAVAPMRVAA
jgi:hypothetical protein